MEAETPTPPSEYINNPFSVAVRGINALFLSAQSVAFFLIIVSLLSYAPNLRQSSPSTPSNEPQMPSGDALLHALPIIIGAGIVVLAVILAVTTLINGICAYTTARVARGETTTLKEAATATVTHFKDLLLLQLLMTVKLLGWSLLLIVPGVIMSIRYSFAMTAYFDKQLRGNAAIKHSVALTRGSWITTFGSQMLFNAITFTIITPLVQTGVNTILYRQFSAMPNDKRPGPHGLSIMMLVLVIISAILGVLAAAALAFYTYQHGVSIDGTPFRKA